MENNLNTPKSDLNKTRDNNINPNYSRLKDKRVMVATERPTKIVFRRGATSTAAYLPSWRIRGNTNRKVDQLPPVRAREKHREDRSTT